VKHDLLNDGGLGLVRFKMFLSRTAKHTSSVMKVKARKSYDNNLINDTRDYAAICQLTEPLDTP